jgi:HK97 gp10 family phage protein
VRKATRNGSKIIRDEVRRLAPVRTGRLRKNIMHKGRRGKRTYEKASVFVRTAERTQRNTVSGAGFGTSQTYGSVAESRADKKDAFYWRFVAEGTKYMPPFPFHKIAAERSFNQTVNYVYDETIDGLTKEVRQLSQGAKK